MLTETQRRQYLARIENALLVATKTANELRAREFALVDRGGRDVVTEVDRRLCDLLHKELVRPGEGWLSEEHPDDTERLGCSLCWVVDPLDGTREFVDGIPEWCISIGLVEDGIAIAGGTSNPASGEVFLGALNCGVTLNGEPVQPTNRSSLNGALVLASRSECKRGEWALSEKSSFSIQPMGSVAYKLSRVAAGLADATWTLTPKHEWDVAGGVALVRAAGGWVSSPDGLPPEFNRAHTLLPGLIACEVNLRAEIFGLLRGPRWRR
jgi:myo-inositol-1(or 4)-monophosphatase